MSQADARAGIPRITARSGPAVLGYGFRPFFLAAAVWAVVAMVLWLPAMMGAPVLASAFDPLTWHVHEMLFGFVGAAIAGFLLTAIPNWTGRMPLQGTPLLGLVALWFAGRVAVLVSAPIGPWPAAAVDLAFYAVLLAVIVREIVVGKNWRNLVMAIALVLFLVANALMHLEAVDLAQTAALGYRLAIAVVTMLIVLIGGRIIPSFTRNWLAKRHATALPAPFGPVDKAVMAVSVLALVAWTIEPLSAVTALLAALAAVMNLIRLARWRGYATLAEPLVTILHVGYVWVPIGFALMAAGAVDWVPAAAAVHALGAGAFATMIMAVTTRATLGHTGRALHAGPATTILYVLVTLAAALRLAAWGLPALYLPLVHSAGSAWIAAFLGFVLIYGRMLVTPRPDGKPG
jgi:uncharacterized protein involved in response to NO